jgi:anaerobic C4-dicarboxylate transporter
MYHDAAYKSTTKLYTIVKIASKLYRAVNLIIRRDIVKTEITNIVQGTGHVNYTYLPYAYSKQPADSLLQRSTYTLIA